MTSVRLAAPVARRSVRARLLAATPLALASALALSPAAATAQHSSVADDARRGFENSWYWGAKGGVMRFGTIAEGNVTAPLAGAEWLVTHKRGGLLVSAEQAFFDKNSAVFDAGMENGARSVRLRNARRFAAAALAFPTEWGPLRPYGGVGLALEAIRDAQPGGEFDDQAQFNAVMTRIDNGQSRVTVFGTVGAQAQWGRAAFFVQANASPAQSRSLFNKGGTAQIEGGVRLNLADAIER